MGSIMWWHSTFNLFDSFLNLLKHWSDYFLELMSMQIVSEIEILDEGLDVYVAVVVCRKDFTLFLDLVE